MHPTPLLAAIAAALTAGQATAQIPVFSIDWRSTTVGLLDTFTATPITEGDLLAPNSLVPMFGPLPLPGILESGGVLAPVGLGLAWHGACVGHPGGTPCLVEVDALSHGLDKIMGCSTAGLAPPDWTFSVRSRGMGIAFTPAPPAVWTEAACGDEAADTFIGLGVPCGPIPPASFVGGNTGRWDANGLLSCSGFVYPGLGLSEAIAGLAPDDLDGLDDDVPDQYFPRSTCTYFSLDSAFIDPVLLIPNSGSAVAHGFVGGDVLMSCPSCAPAIYAPALVLGLDFAGPDSDDLDALVLRENGLPGYQRSVAPYDWLTGATDMLFFSVRRGSAIIGMPDAFSGMPIEAGDILVPTGALGGPPGIWIPGEALGLSTLRTMPGVPHDDIDALDVLHEPQPGSGFCFGDGSGTACPCLNSGATGRGCANSVNPLGGLLWGNGTTSITNDTLLLTCSGLPNIVQCLYFQSTAPILAGAVFGDGKRCVTGSIVRLGVRRTLCGNREFGHGVPGDPAISVAGNVTTPGARYYQVWYRNAAAFCTPATYNLTNGYQVTWTP